MCFQKASLKTCLRINAFLRKTFLYIPVLSISLMTPDIISYAVKNGFIWGPEPEIYGGSAGFYTFGPLGKLLKNNAENALRSVFIKNNFWEVECPSVMPKRVWEASGHVGGFTDPLIKDVDGNVYRADKIIQDWAEKNGKDYDTLGINEKDFDQLRRVISKNKIKAPNSKTLVPEVTAHDLMMKTVLGYDTEAYNRPETATTTYLPFNRYYDFFRKKVPFGVFQIGKAFRNEISPRQNVLRGREFTQAEAQLFITPEFENKFESFTEVSKKELPLWDWKAQKSKKSVILRTVGNAIEKKIVKKQAYAWCLYVAYCALEEMGFPKEKIRFRQHFPDEMAHYADDAWDLEVKTNTFGWVEVCGVHDRTDYDLKRHAEFSGQKMLTEDKRVPHILEIAFGPDRLTFCLIDLFVREEKERTVFKIPQKMAPIKAAVFPLVKKDGLPNLAKKVYETLLDEGIIASFDMTGSIGRMYRRMDEKGTPYCITIDFDSLKQKTVTVRDRDSMKQRRITIDELAQSIKELVLGKKKFSHVGSAVT